MHVVHIINNLVFGGAERFLVELVAQQAALGCRVDVLTLAEPNPLASEITSAQSNEITYRGLGRARLNDPRLLTDVRDALAPMHPDVVHTHLFYADVFGRLAARWLRVPAIVSTEHSTERGALSWKRRAGMRLVARIPQRVVAVSEATRARLLERLRLAPERVTVIANGIALARWRDASPMPRAELGIDERARVVGAVGRLVESKAYDDLLRAVAQLGDSRVEVVMVGDGPHAGSLRELAVGLGLERRVHWLGVRRDVERIVKMLDVFVLPSLWEGHSVALLEAMAAGRACVVSNVPELVQTLGGAGVAVPPRDVNGLAGALRALLGDATARRRYETQALREVERYSIEHAAQRYVSLYNELLDP